MRGWLLVLLLISLPLQLTWAAVSSYCKHESQPTVLHLGHHQHAHTAFAVEQETSKFVDAASVDQDCGVCHASCSVAFQTSSSLSNFNQALFRPDTGSAFFFARYLDLPERPQWAPLA